LSVLFNRKCKERQLLLPPEQGIARPAEQIGDEHFVVKGLDDLAQEVFLHRLECLLLLFCSRLPRQAHELLGHGLMLCLQVEDALLEAFELVLKVRLLPAQLGDLTENLIGQILYTSLHV
jgi:hypothetical protein